MRLMAAALFVVVGAFGTVILLSALGGSDGDLPAWAGVASGLIFLLLLAVAFRLFNGPPVTIESLREQGLLDEKRYVARRAFQIQDWEDEGLHYFIEVDPGVVLYLNGQYLYDYEPVDEEEDDEHAQPRRFPCSEFTVQRHQAARYTLDILCQGAVFEPGLIAHNPGPSWLSRWEDGEIILDRSYDKIKAELGSEPVSGLRSEPGL